MTNTPAKPNLKPAEQNPWYLLATLYGVSGWFRDEIQVKNRVAWNRYYASQWTDEQREALKGRVDAAELVPFDDKELTDIRRQFRERAGKGPIEIPDADPRIDFRECQFDQSIYFGGYIFGHADFSGTKFTSYTSFSVAIFINGADFNSTTFTDSANFSNSIFTEYANFVSATFTGKAEFGAARFIGNANFISSTFTRYTGFSRATFHQAARFTDSELKAPTNFEASQFLGEPPRFHGAKLHEDTVWRGAKWPTAPSNPDVAAQFTNAYERLKLEMDRLKKHEDELVFFAKELECRRVAAGQIRGWPIGAYGVLCHYGQSYLRPLGWLVALILAGAVQFWPALNWDIPLALGVSTANTLGPLGLRKELMEAGTLPADLSRWLRFVSGAQMVIGLLLLFLIGLGLRNRFRMK